MITLLTAQNGKVYNNKNDRRSDGALEKVLRRTESTLSQVQPAQETFQPLHQTA